MITTTSSSKLYIYLKKNSILVVHSQLVRLENKQSLALRQIELIVVVLRCCLWPAGTGHGLWVQVVACGYRAIK